MVMNTELCCCCSGCDKLSVEQLCVTPALSDWSASLAMTLLSLCPRRRNRVTHNDQFELPRKRAYAWRSALLPAALQEEACGNDLLLCALAIIALTINSRLAFPCGSEGGVVIERGGLPH
uniref:Uncharacterized protein n=1 Tax=Knipowitschia caucasica TaxID=637954 RepID=A0AAV2LM18_KNICA